MKPFSPKSKIGRYIMSFIQGFNKKKYWKRRAIVIDPNSKVPTIIKLYYLYYIKRVDAKHLCSFGTNINAGARFMTPPNLMHGPNGIIVGHDAVIGRNCTICQQVTIEHGGAVIGDNCLIGAGAKILASARIGNNVKIGANAVVLGEIPDDATVVLQKPRIIVKRHAEQ